MRAFVVIALIVLSPAASAATASAIVFQHECAALDSTKTGISCGVTDGAMHLHLVKKSNDQYEYSRMIMRYFDLGGRHFRVTADFWPKGGRRECAIRETRAVYCVDYACDASGNNCKKIGER